MQLQEVFRMIRIDLASWIRIRIRIELNFLDLWIYGILDPGDLKIASKTE